MARSGSLRIASLVLVAWTGLAVTAIADDWMVDRLRGDVQVLVGGSWQALQRGDIVSDESRIRSLDGSRVTFTRGAEAIELSGATEIRIFDQSGQRMTTVMQAYGTVTVEAERLDVQHFSIQTPYLAAIVKGTRFTVHSDGTQSNVEVERGLVQVQDYVHGVATDISPGQSAVVSPEIVLDVSGAGAHAPMVTLDGELVSASDADGNFGSDHGSSGNNAGGIGNAYAYGHDNANGNSGNAQGGGNNAGGNGNAYGHDQGNGLAGNGQGPDGNNAGGNGNGNAYGLERGNSGQPSGANGNSGNGNNGNGNGAGGKS